MLCDVAGVDSFDDAAHEANAWIETSGSGLPTLFPVESKPDMLAHILGGNQTNLHSTLVLSDQAAIEWPHKLVRGVQPYSRHTGSSYPNCSTLVGPYVPW